MTLEVRLKAEDLRDLWFNTRIKYLLWLLFLFGLYLAYLVFAEIANVGFAAAGILNVAVYGPIAATGLLGPFFIPRLRARQMIRCGPTLAETRQYSFSDRGVNFRGERMTCDLRWNGFHRIAESRRSFLLYLSPGFGAVIPKRCFSSPEGVVFLRQLIRENFKGKSTLRHD
jgi:YcxB-like protein